MSGVLPVGRGHVHAVEPELLRVAHGPLKVVQQRPGIVALHVHPILLGSDGMLNVFLDPVLIRAGAEPTFKSGSDPTFHKNSHRTGHVLIPVLKICLCGVPLQKIMKK